VHVLISGAHGLVGGQAALHLLGASPATRVTLLDVSPAPDALAAALAAFGDRVVTHLGDVSRDATWDGLPGAPDITHVVHGAAVTHLDAWERDAPERFFAVNVGGTLAMLRRCRSLPGLRRVVHLSSGGVYGDPSPNSPEGPQTEDGPFLPPELYAISKWAAERAAVRVGGLHGIDVRVVRPSTVFGALERPTPGRRTMSLPYAIAAALRTDEPLRVTERSLDATGDYVGAEDLAAGIAALLRAPAPRHDAYNVAHGRRTTVRELLATAAEVAPALRWTTAPAGPGVLDRDPADRLARHNAYAVARMAEDCGWRPRPLAEQLAAVLAPPAG
jgi:dTDP-glucose 4,6-dehydratase